VKFDGRWDHGWRLVFRRVYQFFVGPTANVHLHKDDGLWHWFPLIDPFFKCQRPVGPDGSRWHFEKCGVDLIWLQWTLCLHWIDN
jgi:hypothetical protein